MAASAFMLKAPPHLQCHWHTLLAHIVVVLVSVEHDHSVGQSKPGVVGFKRRSIHFLHSKTTKKLLNECYKKLPLPSLFLNIK